MNTKQRKIYNFIINFALSNNYLPTMQEIADGIFIAKSEVHRYMTIMAKNGIIVRCAKGKGYSVSGLKYVKES